MKIFNGKKIAGQILKNLAAEIKKAKLRPKLAVILVGEDEASKLYVRLKKEAGKKIGVEVAEHRFSAQAREDEIISYIKRLNEDSDVSGIIVQLPLPAVLNKDKVIGAIDPGKDVDGFHESNRKKLEKGREELLPVLPQVILAALENAKKLSSGKKALALVNSEIFGQTLKTVLARQGWEMDYLARNTCVVLGAEKDLKNADIIISVCGCPNMIKGEMIKPGAILIDGGISRYHDGKVVGDIDRESVAGRAAFLTPVPGGLGPLTVALLLRNVFLAAKKS